MKKRVCSAAMVIAVFALMPQYALAQDAGDQEAPQEEAGDDPSDAGEKRGDDGPDTLPPASKKQPIFPLPIAPSEASPYKDGKIVEDLFDIHTIRVINVPMRLLPPSLDQGSDPLWVRGERPKENLLAVTNAVPQAAARISLTDSDGSSRDVLLLRATLHPEYGVSAKAPESIAKGGDIFCGSTLAKPSDLRVFCLEDVDGDKRFDRIAPGATGSLLPQTFDVATIYPPAPLATPLTYAVVDEAELPKTEIEWRNCGQDWDKPYFAVGQKASALRGSDGKIDLDLLLRAADPGKLAGGELSRVLSMLGARRGAPCQRGERIDNFQGVSEKDLAKGSILVNLDSMIFSVGPKKKGAKVKLLGYTGDRRRYQIEGRALRRFQQGLSKEQKRVATAQLFDRPVLVSNGEMTVASQPVSSGDQLFAMGFEHGYLAELTEKTKIRTLFSRRSLDAGTLLYGIPMTSRRTVTINGIPQGNFGRPSDSGRSINTRLVWCVPVRDEKTKTDRATGEKLIEIKWSATCLPDAGGSYTILKGQTPAFALRSMRYNAGTSSNSGKPPVKRVENGSFGGALEFRYIVEDSTKARLRFRRETWLGDEKVEEMIDFVRIKNGVATIKTGGAKIEVRILDNAADASSDNVETKDDNDDEAAVSYVATLVKPAKAGGAVATRFSVGTFTFGGR